MFHFVDHMMIFGSILTFHLKSQTLQPEPYTLHVAKHQITAFTVRTQNISPPTFRLQWSQIVGGRNK